MAGEASGDVLGSRLMAALRRARPELQFRGIGGVRMTEQGLATLFPMRDLAVMGLVEILPRVRSLARRLDQAVADIDARRPDLVVTIDSPGFALRLLKRISGLGIPRVHYVAPQVWAWREHRVREYPGLWDRLLCLLPFEPAFFLRHGLEARFVGHPVLQSGADTGDAARFRSVHRIAPEAPVLVLMPGSRRSEVPRLLPVFGRALSLLAARVPGLVPVVVASPVVADIVLRAARRWPIQPIIRLRAAGTRAVSSAPLMVILPLEGAMKPSTRSMMVDLPAPEAPVRSRISPATMRNDRCSSTGRAGSQAKQTSSNARVRP